MMTLSLKLSLLLTDSGTSVDGWFGSSWSRLTACITRWDSGGPRCIQVPRYQGTEYIDTRVSNQPPLSTPTLSNTWCTLSPLGHLDRKGERLFPDFFTHTCRSTSAWRPWLAPAGCRWPPTSSPPRRLLPLQRPSVCWTQTFSIVAIALFADALI